MEILQRYHIDIRLFGKHLRVGEEFSYITGAICDFAVWSHQQPRRHQSGQETPLCAKRLVNRKTFHRRKEPLYSKSSGQFYQAGYCWAQATTPSPDLPCPSEWGWKRKEPSSSKANWTSLPEAMVACRELLRSGCKKGCKENCKCSKAALQCIALCQCGGQCTEN